MAKQLGSNEEKAKKVQAPKDDNLVVVKDLEAEFGVQASSIRQIIRSKGKRAPQNDVPEGTFGPRTKYSWPKDSAELEEVKSWIKEAIAESEKEEGSEPEAETKEDTEKV